MLIRIASVAVMGIMPQDAYYYFYSENLALSYFDHPPMVAWMLWLFTSVLGKSIIAVHATDFIVTMVTIWLSYQLAQRILPLQKAMHALLLLFSTIMMSILSVITTPDVPLMLFWTLSLLFAHKAITDDKWFHWLITGAMMGCAFLSKYTALFLPAGLFLFLLLQPEHRRKILNYRFISLCIVLVVVSLPVVTWNVQHDFISFKFQSGTRLSGMSFSRWTPANFSGTLGHQMFIIVPVLFVALFFFLWKTIKRGIIKWKRMSSNQVFLLCFFVPMVFFFFCVSVIYWVKINWMMPAYISGIIWVSIYLRSKWVKWQLIVSLMLHTLAFLFIAFYPVSIKSDDTFWGWEVLNNEMERLMKSKPGYFLLAADDYKTSAVLHFTSGRKVYSANLLGQPALQYMIVDKDAPQQLQGKDALFFDSQPRFENELKSENIPGILQQHFETVTELEPILIRNKKGTVLRKFLVYDCKNYKP